MDYNRIDTPSEEDFIRQATDCLKTSISDALKKHDRCVIGLSGGSTPGPVYEALGMEEDIDWSKVHLFLVDERHIDPADERSNQHLVRGTLLSNASIPEENLIFPDTTLPIEDCVDDYTGKLIELLRESPPDVITLGLGTDGHIASLFPPVTEDAFGEVLVLHTTTDAFDVHDRISISPLVIMASQGHLLLLKGEEKKKVFEECVSEHLDPSRWPLQVALGTGRVTAIFL